MVQGAIANERDALDGLSAAEVEARIQRGQINDVPQGPSRTTRDIIRSNVVTRFNILLSVMLVVTLMVAPPQDAMFGVVMVLNAAIGIIQELRAKQTLDRLTLLTAPKARVVRDGTVEDIAVSGVVLDDVLEMRPGDQIVVDGTVLAVRGLEVNESLLTGEADAVRKRPGDGVLSGSFTVAGIGRYRATKVGPDAYAAQLADEARRFTLVKSELMQGINWILAAITWLMIPTVILLVWSQMDATNSVAEGLQASIAGMVGMVPQGLVLLTSIAFAVAVVRLGRQNVLVQELPAVEMLARVDIVCFDKTGTLTKGKLSVQEIQQIDPDMDSAPALAALATADPTPNATLLAIGEAYPAQERTIPVDTVPFSSARKWSAASYAETGTFVLGAPEMVIGDDAELSRQAETRARLGQRVLLLAHTPAPLDGDRIPPDLRPISLVVLGDDIRPDAADTLRYFADQGVAAKVISGDHPSTVAAIAQEVGIPGAENTVDARDLPTDDAQLARVVEEGTVFGRVAPHQKRAMVRALQAKGHVVAMTGDGVNDVLALKDSDIGVAMGSGSSASRAVAQLVLIDGAFNTLPSVVGEGRRVIANIERVANLFITKTVYAFLLAIAVGVAGIAFPFIPRHLTLVGSITIGIPAFVLALAPSAKRARPGFVKRVLRFALPTGTLAALATYAAYEMALSETALEGLDEATQLLESRTTATIVLASIGLIALAIVSRPLLWWRKLLVASMVILLVIVLMSPRWREFFELELPRSTILLAALGIVALTGSFMALALMALGWIKQVPDRLPEILGPEAGGDQRLRWVPRFRSIAKLAGDPAPEPAALDPPTADVPPPPRQ